MKARTIDLLAILVALAALGSTVALASRKKALASVPELEARRIRDQEGLAVGHVLGDSGAGTTLVVFSDFQCRFCKALHDTLALLKSRNPQRLQIVYRQFPLMAIHPNAFAAAVASECAAAQDSFTGFAATLFSVQDSIGSIPWVSFAQRAGVRNLEAFGSCMSSGRMTGRVEEDLRAGNRLGISGTPALIVKDELIIGAPSLAQLEQLLERTE